MSLGNRWNLKSCIKTNQIIKYQRPSLEMVFDIFTGRLFPQNVHLEFPPKIDKICVSTQ